MDEVVSANITQLYNSIIEFYGGTPAKHPLSFFPTEKYNALYYNKASSGNNDLIPVFINKTVCSSYSHTEDVKQYFKEINFALDRYIYATTNFIITTRTINCLSMQEYEKQEFEKDKSEGRIAFCRNKEMRPPLAVMIKEETVKFQLPISVKDMKLMRKLLEVCGNNYALLLENDKSGQFASVVGYINSKDAESLPVLTIDGKLSWTFFAYGYSVKHYHGDYKIQEDNDTHNISAKIKELIGLEISDKTLDELKDKIQKHAHGALLIFMKNPAKAKELCEYQRGFEISPLSNEKTINLTDDSNFEDMFAFLCRIDGALIFDSEGVLISIGTIVDGIVDGKAKTKGSYSRGSRYNSTVTFINTYSEDDNPICALVFSEDGGVNYIDKENCQ